MKFKGIILAILIFGSVIGSLTAPSLAAQDPQAEQEQLPKEYIPKEVKTLMLQGMDTGQARTDIPFDIFKLLYLRTSAAENLHGIFFFRCKNAELGFIGKTEVQAAEEQQEVSAFQATPAKLAANNNVFLHFKQLDGQYEKDVYVPFNQEAEGATYDAEAEEYYTIGYPLPAGEYTMAMAITSIDLQKIGIQYFEFTLPNPAAYVDELGITPVFFAKRMDRIPEIEMTTEVHKGCFTYGVYEIEPNLDQVFSPGDMLDIFFFIFGAKPSPMDPSKVDLEINYEILKDEERIVRWAPQPYQYPVVSQPLPMKQTVVVKTTDEQGNTTETQEERDLEAGAYTFSIQITDKVTGVTAAETVEIEVK